MFAPPSTKMIEDACDEASLNHGRLKLGLLRINNKSMED